jgi:hypothetical protein
MISSYIKTIIRANPTVLNGATVAWCLVKKRSTTKGGTKQDPRYVFAYDSIEDRAQAGSFRKSIRGAGEICVVHREFRRNLGRVDWVSRIPYVDQMSPWMTNTLTSVTGGCIGCNDFSNFFKTLKKIKSNDGLSR